MMLLLFAVFAITLVGCSLMVVLHRYTASLVKCFQGESKRLEIPVMIDDRAPHVEEATSAGVG